MTKKGKEICLKDFFSHMKERNTRVKLLLLPFLGKLPKARVDTGIRVHQFVPEFVCEVSLI
jgi:hypothetical protein